MISEDMHTALQENAHTLRSRDDEIAQLAARCQQLEIERRTNLSEIARLRGALTIERQQGQQARPQGYGVHQGQVPAPGWPNEGQQGGGGVITGDLEGGGEGGLYDCLG